MNLENYKIERFNNFEYRSITSMIEDDNNNIWFGTKQGIIKYDYNSNKFTQPQNLDGDFHINSTFIDENNSIYFGGIKGVIKFNPEHLDLSFQKPKVFLTNFKLFNKEVPVKKEGILQKNIQLQKNIVLKHSDNVITFNYAGLKYPFSQDLEYAIKMENFDKSWREVSNDRTATYTNLSPGKYIFKVKSKEIGDDWGTDFTLIHLEVLKPYWLTWWAYLVYFLLLILIFYFIRKNIIAWGKLKSSLELEKLTHEKDNELYNSKQQFFTNISHEIRTPITLILSSINRLSNSNKIKDGKQIKAAHTIRRNSNLLLRLVNELLDVRKLETNEIDLKISKNDFVSFAKEIYTSFSDIASDRNIKYNFKTDENRIDLWFDKNQLEKVIFNLLSNAFKFTNDKGEIQFKIENTNKKILFSVKDNGIGLSTNEKEKIFKRFYQVKETHTEKNRGFGLGLSIVKDIVKLHKGQIEVKSEFKKGSSFEVQLLKGNSHFNTDIILDINNSENKNTLEKLQNKISVRNTKQETILIIEDNLDIQESLKELLENENYFILQAFNGLDGLKTATTNLPNLIISDIMMPEMDGFQLSNKIKTNGITNHIPVILLTAKTANDDKLKGFEKGADAYITKPYNEEFLINRIKNILKSRKLLKQKFETNNLLNPKELAVNSKDQIFLENLYKILEDNLQSSNLKADFISQSLNMSHSSMYKKIKSLTGLTFMEFIRDYRLSIAKQLIEEMGYSVSEACYKVGYSDRKYFSKLFKNKFKQNPSFYLKS
jgi:signal transduction histidine kinase/DNA-binding response OmpR family regulator